MSAPVRGGIGKEGDNLCETFPQFCNKWRTTCFHSSFRETLQPLKVLAPFLGALALRRVAWMHNSHALAHTTNNAHIKNLVGLQFTLSANQSRTSSNSIKVEAQTRIYPEHVGLGWSHLLGC